ncbi:MAG: hypothetical protein HQ582_21780 [Planctomycetes bacterium]|nr:hypothetical protein [Planctomycetota bacterium]
MGSGAAKIWLANVAGYNVVRVVLGLVLLAAAGLKGHQLATEPIVATGLLHGRWFLIGLVEVELLFGLWLLIGLYPEWTWRAAVACFAFFSCVTLAKALSGEPSCGCFGKVPVQPLHMLVFDVGVIALLLRCRPVRVESRYSLGLRTFTVRLSAISAVWLLIGIPAAVAMGSYEPSRLTEEGDVLGNDESVVLEPETWGGKRFPLVKHVDIGDKLLRGTWLVLLYDHECSACRDAVSKYEELAEDLSRNPDCPAIAIVECPPYANEASLSEDACAVRGRLRNTKRWRVPAPVAILVDEGEVQTVFEDARDMDLLRAIWGS